MSGYRPWDQGRHLGPPPWKPSDPALVAWEAAHGHDVRLKCYAEFGCLVLSAAEGDEAFLLAADAREVELLADRERARSIAVRLEQQLAYLTQQLTDLHSNVEHLLAPWSEEAPDRPRRAGYGP